MDHANKKSQEIYSITFIHQLGSERRAMYKITVKVLSDNGWAILNEDLRGRFSCFFNTEAM